MSRRFIELAVRARRFVACAPRLVSSKLQQPRRRELTQFSFRLALVVDLAYVGIGTLGGAVIGRTFAPAAIAESHAHTLSCRADSIALPRLVR